MTSQAVSRKYADEPAEPRAGFAGGHAGSTMHKSIFQAIGISAENELIITALQNLHFDKQQNHLWDPVVYPDSDLGMFKTVTSGFAT